MKKNSQKDSELNWFKDFCPELEIPQHFDPLHTKFQLMKSLKAHTIKSLSNSVTLIWPLPPSFAGKKVSYRYQRQDFQIQGECPLEVFYPGLTTNLEVSGHFTRSGQSAFFGLNLALKNSDETYSLKNLNSYTYFESLRVLDGLKIKRNKTSVTALLDSSTSEFPPLHYLKDLTVKRLIVDTTNWNLNAENIQNILQWSEEQNVELFLIRSHLKLDSLGAEYGLLGSVVRIAQDQNPEWEKLFLETLSYAGLLATHEQLYPFLWDKTFLELTALRTKRIQSNTQFLTKELEPFLKTLKHPMRLRLYEHNLFFGVYYEGQADHLPEKFLKLSILHEIPAKYCDSFGFDFLSLTNVVSYYENTEESLLRFCSGDNSDDIENVLKLIKDYLVVFDQRT